MQKNRCKIISCGIFELDPLQSPIGISYEVIIETLWQLFAHKATTVSDVLAHVCCTVEGVCTESPSSSIFVLWATWVTY